MRTRATLLGVIGVILVLASASPARAGWKLERANAIAYAVWGQDLAAVCPGGVLGTDYGTTAAAAGVEASAKAWANPGVCTIHFSPAPGALRDFEPYCSVFLHEAGHIAGYGHDHTGHGGIMALSPTYLRSSGRVAAGARRSGHSRRLGRRTVHWTGTDPRCANQGVPFMKSRGLL